MNHLLDRGLHARPTASAAHRHLPSHVVNLAGVKPTSDIRRRQLVQAQRRSREKSRLLKRLATRIVPPPPGSADRVDDFHSRLVHRFIDYLALVTQFTKAQCPPTPRDIFTDDVECDGEIGRHGVDALWLQWAAVCPGYQLIVEATEVVAIDDMSNMTLRVTIELCIPMKGKAGPFEPSYIHSQAGLRGDLVVQFQGATGAISRLDPAISFLTSPSRHVRPYAMDPSPRKRPRHVTKADAAPSKMSMQFLLNAALG